MFGLPLQQISGRHFDKDAGVERECVFGLWFEARQDINKY